MTPDLIRNALDKAGYTESPATLTALIECFLDYVAAGYWRDIDLEEAKQQIDDGDITTLDMCRALLR